jgi:hypothetical protein
MRVYIEWLVTARLRPTPGQHLRVRVGAHDGLRFTSRNEVKRRKGLPIEVMAFNLRDFQKDLLALLKGAQIQHKSNMQLCLKVKTIRKLHRKKQEFP